MAVEEAAESCGSHAAAAGGGGAAGSSSPPTASGAQSRKQQQQQRHKLEVYTQVLRRLHDAGVPEGQSPGFEDELWSHFNRLPARYAMDVNVERAEDVLTHKRLLELAKDPARRPAFAVRAVQVSPILDGNQTDADSNTAGEVASRLLNRQQSIHPPPAFGSSTNLEALALEASKSQGQDDDSISDNVRSSYRPMHEITFSTIDKPKLLSELTCLLGELGLNIQEAHAFSTNDGYSLDVFVVVGWHSEETEDLIEEVKKEISKIEETQAWSSNHSWSSPVENMQIVENSAADHVEIPRDGASEWEIDVKLLNCGNKVASGSYGDLYRGTYCSQDVAIKVLKPERVNVDMQREFAQEVYIMRFVTSYALISCTTGTVAFCDNGILASYFSKPSLLNRNLRFSFCVFTSSHLVLFLYKKDEWLKGKKPSMLFFPEEIVCTTWFCEHRCLNPGGHAQINLRLPSGLCHGSLSSVI